MAKKGITQKLKEENEALRKELEEYKGFLANSEAKKKSFQDQSEDLYPNARNHSGPKESNQC